MARGEALRLQRRYTKLRHCEHLAAPDPAAASARPHPRRRPASRPTISASTTPYSYSYLSFAAIIRAKALMDGYWKRSPSAARRTTSPYRAGFAQTVCVAETDAGGAQALREAHPLFLQSLPARLRGLRRRAGLSHDQDDPVGRAVAIRPAARLCERDLGRTDRRRPRHRRLARDCAPAHGGHDQDAARRQHLLPHACRRHAEGEVHDSTKLFAEKVMPKLRGPLSRMGK